MLRKATILLGIVVLAAQAAGAGGRSWLGISVRDSDPPGDGVVILSVAPGSPAAVAGLQAGDVILTSAPGDPCGVECFGREIRTSTPGTRIVVRLVREGDRIQVPVVLGREPEGLRWIVREVEPVPAPEALVRGRLEAMLSEMPELPRLPDIVSAPGARAGLDLIPVTPELRSHLGGPEDAGMLVGGVEAESPAATAGIAAGDLLVAVNGRKIRSAHHWVLLTSSVESGAVAVDLVRDGNPRQVTLELPRKVSAAQVPPHWPALREERSEAVREAIRTLDSSLELEETSPELRTRLRQIREQLERALARSEKTPDSAPRPRGEQDPAGR